MDELYTKFGTAKEAYQELIAKDFPDLDFEAYIEELRRKSEQSGIEPEIRVVDDEACIGK